MTDEEFAELTQQYVAATEARLALIRADIPATPEALAAYREVADREWELGQVWDSEVSQAASS